MLEGQKSAGDFAFQTLRLGVAGCFIGHGAFGIITKAAWLPYFSLAGISAPMAWRLMPWVGAMDISVGILALFWPCRLLFIWAAGWALWTAACRPLAGESIWEFVERAGNYGVPFALLLGIGFSWPLLGRIGINTFRPEAWPRVALALRVTTTALLIGHAGCILAAPTHASFVRNYIAIWPDSGGSPVFAWAVAEALLGAFVLVRPSITLLLGICAWKLGTEALFLAAHAPVWEFIERFGSYAAPLSFACILYVRWTPAEVQRGTLVLP